MKSSSTWAGNVRAIVRNVTVLAIAVIVVGMSITPVLARDDRGHRGRGYHHGHACHDRGYYGGYYAPGYYPAPGYAPPPVVYAPPPPPPGINFVFPIHIR